MHNNLNSHHRNHVLELQDSGRVLYKSFLKFLIRKKKHVSRSLQNFGTLANITHHEMVRLRTRGENLAVIFQGLSPGVPVVQRNHGFINFQPRAPVPTQHREDNPRLQVTLRIRLEKKISLVKGAIYPSNLDNKTAKHLCFFFFTLFAA